MNPFYVHLRPFSITFLNTVTQKFNVVFYSSFDKELLIFLADKIQTQKLYSTIWVSNSKCKEVKLLSKFHSQRRNKSNIVIVDHDPEVSYNFMTMTRIYWQI